MHSQDKRWGFSLKIMGLISQCLEAKAHIEKGKNLKKKKTGRKENITHKAPIFISPWTLPFLSFQSVLKCKDIYDMDLFSINQRQIVRNLLQADELVKESEGSGWVLEATC